MRLPIALALGWPDRIPDAAPPMAWTTPLSWQFEPLDDEAFPAVRLARQVGQAGRCLPAIYNAANEECVAAFLDGRLPFTGIVDTVSAVVDAAVDSDQLDEPGSVEAVLAAEQWARDRAHALAFGKNRPMAVERTGN
jgi:1-deoxy-D-xylulose-5-phosphate reductoisomerase